MPLAGFDLVLGTQGMATLGPIVWDFTKRTISFQLWGRSYCWMGVPSASTPGLHTTTTRASLLNKLLATFGDVFADPTGLPPPHARDHNIILQPSAPLVAVRSHRYRWPTRSSWSGSAPP
jgi:hypothetical protein